MSAPKEDRVTKDTPNPANSTEQVQRRRRRGGGRRHLEVEPLAGYVLHWSRESRIQEKLDCGWELVDRREVHINNTRTYGSLKGAGGNTDLGSNVSIVADGGTGERLVLMKQKQEFWDEDQSDDDALDARILGGIFSGEQVVKPDGTLGPQDGTTYSRSQYVPLFQRPARKIRLAGGQAPNPVGLNARPRPGAE